MVTTLLSGCSSTLTSITPLWTNTSHAAHNIKLYIILAIASTENEYFSIIEAIYYVGKATQLGYNNARLKNINFALRTRPK